MSQRLTPAVIDARDRLRFHISITRCAGKVYKMATKVKMTRIDILHALVERDGLVCKYPGCQVEINLSEPDGPWLATIDHYIPQSRARDMGWTEDEIWDLSNLKIMHRKCNARKSDLLPNEDGTLPEKRTRTFRYRRDKRAGRPELCLECDNGHNLLVDEVCASCGCNAQRFPRWAKVKYQDCDHELYWCIWCSIGVVERPNSIGTAMRQADSTELGELFDKGL